VAAGLAVLVVALLGSRLFGRTAGLIAGLLLAVDAFFVQYAQTARSYALLVLLVALSSYFFVAELERPSRTTRALYVLSSVAAVYAHIFAVFVLIAHALTLVAMRRREAFTREWMTAAVAIAVLLAPAVALAGGAGTGAIDWIPKPRPSDLVDLPGWLAGHSPRLGYPLLALGAFGLLVAVLRDRERWRAGFVAAWLLVPVLLAFAVSYVQPMFLDYYLIVALPAFVLLAAAGIARLPGRPLQAVVLVVLVVLSADRLSAWYDHPSEENYRGAAGYVLRAMRPTDAVVYYPTWAEMPIVYYWHRAGAAGPTRMGLAPGVAPATRPPRIWLVMRESDAPPATQRRLAGGLRGAYEPVAGVPHFRRVIVSLYRARG
jgi:mannosyltransferase